MIKVCHLSSVHQPYDVRIFHKECISLAANGYEVHFVVSDDAEKPAIETKDGVIIHRVKKVIPGLCAHLKSRMKCIMKQKKLMLKFTICTIQNYYAQEINW